ncbi:MAG: TilS substrate-binding domain-containing protein, partial [Verrucomicrobiota bacterium]
ADFCSELRGEMQDRAEALLRECTDEMGRLEVRQLVELTQIGIKQVIHLWLKVNLVPERSQRLVESIVEIAAPHSQVAKVNLPGGCHVRRTSGKLYIINSQS